MRVGVPLEQCWHEVPGGTARASIDLVAALDARADVEVVGVVGPARGAPAAPLGRPRRGPSRCRCPGSPLYETWHGLRRPRVERATGPVDVLHVAGRCRGRRAARRWS